MIDTCQAATMAKAFRSPNILAISSSLKDESSYSYTIDKDIGVALIDRFTWKTLDFFNKNVKTAESNATLQDLMDAMDSKFLQSTASARTDLFPRTLKQIKITEFFSNEKQVQMTDIENIKMTKNDVLSGYQLPEWTLESPSLKKLMFDKERIRLPESKMVEFDGKEKTSILGILFLALLIFITIKNYFGPKLAKCKTE
jgi:glycosylphosphatidylinositol transamidase (GPIT) subunit GPI8